MDPPLALALPYAFHEFAYAVGELKIEIFENSAKSRGKFFCPRKNFLTQKLIFCTNQTILSIFEKKNLQPKKVKVEVEQGCATGSIPILRVFSLSVARTLKT